MMGLIGQYLTNLLMWGLKSKYYETVGLKDRVVGKTGDEKDRARLRAKRGLKYRVTFLHNTHETVWHSYTTRTVSCGILTQYARNRMAFLHNTHDTVWYYYTIRMAFLHNTHDAVWHSCAIRTKPCGILNDNDNIYSKL